MVEQQQKRLEDAMTKIADEIDREYLRRMQADMHRCAARCCDNQDYSMLQVHRCVEKCSDNLVQVKDYVQNEFQNVQNRLQRCVMDCNDEVKDRMSSSNPSQTDMDKLHNQFESCAIRCVDRHVQVLPAMLQRMKEVLAKKKADSLALLQ